jgi:hypothetical protein
MKLWFKIQGWAIGLALFYIFFIFNEGHLGGLLFQVVSGFALDWIKGVIEQVIDSFVDGALHR